MTLTKHTHPNDCPDHRAADADRKQHEAELMKSQLRQQALAHADWFEWFPPSRPK
jgi:hypothetical protein